MSQYLIGNWLLWGIIVGILYSIVFSLIATKIESMVLMAVLAIVIQGIIAWILWKLSTAISFKKKTISYDDIPNVMRNIIIFTISICVITGVYNISNVNSSIDKAIELDYNLKLSESVMSSLYDDTEMAKYKTKKEETIKETKNKLYKYLLILEVGLTSVYLAVLPLEKKEILKYVE